MKARRVYSLDYDGCAFILSEENHDAFTNFIQSYLREYLDNPKNERLRNLFETNELLQNENKLNHLIKAVIKETAMLLEKELFQLPVDTNVTLMVGSNRQNHGDDVYNSYMNNTISCFTAYEAVAQKFNLDFCKLLLSDLYDAIGPREVEREAGTTMNSSNKPDINYLKGKTKEAICEYIKPYAENPPYEDKQILIHKQLEHVKSKLHEAARPVSFVFIDDRADMINPLIKNIKKLEEGIPESMNIKLIQFNSMSNVLKNIIKYLKREELVLEMKEMYNREKQQAVELSAHSLYSKKRKIEETQSNAIEPQISPSL